jgi:hypothetical protein
VRNSSDELQVMQLDEFQIPIPSSNETQHVPLYKFHARQWDERIWLDFRDLFKKRIRPKGKNTFLALPFYDNISLLAYRKDLLHENEIKSWKNLVEKCKAWEKKHPDPQMLFFDFPQVTPENYNCLFFEILISLNSFPENPEQCPLREWLEKQEAIEAGQILRCLCRRSYFNSQNKGLIKKPIQGGISSPNIINVADAVVWRHWYSTYNQMISTISPDLLDQIMVSALPGGIAIAGEWYLGIPAYSAAPEIGLEIIKLLTSREAELERLNYGIGLPTRETFYSRDASITSTLVSPHFSMPLLTLKELMNNAFRRSTFGCYLRISTILAFHLKKIIEIPDKDENTIRNKIETSFKSLVDYINFLSGSNHCILKSEHSCKFSKGVN